MSDQPSMLKTTLAGGFGGACLVLVGHPLDTIKVRIQTMTIVPGQPPPYSGTFDCASKIIAKEGPFGLYKGIYAPLTGVIPMYALCFFGYGFGKKVFLKEDSMRNLDAENLSRIGLAGATSAVFTTPILAPLERIKCVLQIQKKEAGVALKYPGGVFATGKQMMKEGGIASVNRGFFSTMLRDSVASFFYFSSYEYSKYILRQQSNDANWVPLIAGGIAGIFNWLGCLPIDTLKSKLQVAPEGKYPNGIRSVFNDVVKKEGLASLYRGFGPVMIRAFPANAACFYGYEMALKFLTSVGME